MVVDEDQLQIADEIRSKIVAPGARFTNVRRLKASCPKAPCIAERQLFSRNFERVNGRAISIDVGRGSRCKIPELLVSAFKKF
jgi:hypothetical protein